MTELYENKRTTILKNKEKYEAFKKKQREDKIRDYYTRPDIEEFKLKKLMYYYRRMDDETLQNALIKLENKDAEKYEKIVALLAKV